MPPRATDTPAAYDFETYRWWYAQVKSGADGYSLTDKIEIDIVLFLDWLYSCGFRYTKINDIGILFRVENNRILHEIEVPELSQHIVKTIESMPDEIPCMDRRGLVEDGSIHKRMLLEKVLKAINYLVDVKKLNAYLGPKEYFKMNTDGPAEKFIYFRNGYLHVNARGIEFCDYKELPGYIWHSEIVDRDYTPADKQTSYAEKFFQLVANGAEPDYSKMPAADAQQEKDRRATRFSDLCSIAGYLAHGYTNYELKAIILTDSRLNENNEPNGRSGKSLFMLLVASIICADVTQNRQRTYVSIDGKDFDQGKDFKFQQASHETKLMFLNDAKRSFKFESFFNYITDGQDIEKKGKDSIRIKCKWAIATNLSIALDGESSKARACVFEFSDYFSATRRPKDIFNHWFFTDWDHAEYMRMYQFMARCCQNFFADGCQLPKPQEINYHTRVLQEHTHRDFMEYMELDWNPQSGLEYCLRDQYHDFLEKYDHWKNKSKNFDQVRFTRWVHKYTELHGSWVKYNKATHGRRGADGKTYIKFERKAV